MFGKPKSRYFRYLWQNPELGSLIINRKRDISICYVLLLLYIAFIVTLFFTFDFVFITHSTLISFFHPLVKMNAPNYMNLPCLQVAKDDMKTDEDKEHLVGSWACSMLKHVFKDGKWIITPEKQKQGSKKRPDLVVEEVSFSETGEASRTVRLIVELKSEKGNRFEDGLDQVVTEIQETVESVIDCYIMVQKGTNIGFFEYHNDMEEKEQETDVPHFRRCVPITSNYENQDTGVPLVFMGQMPVPDDLLPIYFKTEKLRKKTSLREEASQMLTPCVFNLDKHPKEISYIFNKMANEPPRTSPC